MPIKVVPKPLSEQSKKGDRPDRDVFDYPMNTVGKADDADAS